MNREKIFSEVIGPCIRKKRRSKGWTLERLAQEIEMDDKHLGRLERGEKSPSGLTLTLIQMVLDLHPDEYIPEFNARMTEKVCED